MRQHRTNRLILTLVLGALFGWLTLAGRSWSAPDPVEDLRDALFIRQEDRRDASAAVLLFRRETLQKRIDALRTISDLRRALMDWREDVDLAGKIQDLDEEMRAQVGRRLKNALEKVAKKGDATSRMAVANLIAEMGPTVRGLLPEKQPKTKEEKEQQERDSWGGFTRSLTPTVIELAHDRDLDVRRMALRALGTINADPRLAVPVFKKVLETPARGAEAEDLHRLAAGGLVQMIKVASALPVTKRFPGELPKRAATRGAGVFITPEELVETASLVVSGAAVGLREPDFQVRLLCLEAFQKAASALGEFPGAIDAKKDFPPAGRALTDDEKKFIRIRYDDVQRLLDERKPILDALTKHGKMLDRTLSDDNPRVRWAAVTAVEQLSHLRLRMRQRALSLPELPKVPRPKVDKDFNALVLGRLPAVAALLGSPDSDLQTRSEAIHYMENLEEDAAPALDAIIQRLADPNRFIRWAAARTVGYLPPEKAVLAVPALAHLIGDTDLEVRMAAAAVLEGFGPRARDALPALKHAILHGDADFRVAVIYTVSSIGPAAAPAIPELIQALSTEQSPDPRVRRAAADVLGKFGPLARAALPALRQLVGDDDPEVRIKASDAILSILPEPK